MTAPMAASPAQALDDEMLFYATRQGAAAEFQAIMRQNNQRLYRVARSILHNETEAEDALQQAYLSAFSGLPKFQGRASFSTWLTRIVVNEALHRLRQQRRAPGLESLEWLEMNGRERHVIPFPLIAAQPDPEHDAMAHDARRSLEAAIDNLPEPFRVVFVMRAVEEMSVEETARCLDIQELTVKTRFHRAKRRLRATLSAQFEGGLSDLFPFGGARCARIANAVLARLGLVRSTQPTLTGEDAGRGERQEGIAALLNAGRRNSMRVETILALARDRLVTIQADALLTDAAKLLCETHRALVVVCDPVGVMVGVITKTDVVRHLDCCQGDLSSVKIADVMTRDVTFCHRSDLLQDTEYNERARLRAYSYC